MSDAKKLLPVWVYDAKGGSQLMELPEGGEPPKGWFFAPPSGVELAGDTSSPATPPTPLTSNERMDAFELRLMKLEGQLAAVFQTLSMMQAEPAKPSERDALVARAKELKLEFHNRLGDDKLRALIADAEAALEAKPVDEA